MSTPSLIEPQNIGDGFSADQPINAISEDVLGRSAFAIRLANALIHWRKKHSLVVAIYGGWGDGKTSFKLMVLDALQRMGDACPIIVEFNPWEWAGQKQLAAAFFEEIGKQIGTDGRGDKVKSVAKRVRLLGKCLNLGGKLLSPFAPAAEMLFPGGSAVFGAAAEGSKKSGEVAEQAAGALETKAELHVESLAEIKRELTAELLLLEKPIIVVLDDVDRLEADQVKLLFQLVKANADFPNLIFLLLFQRDVIETYLEIPHHPGTGTQYLEKIIQVGIDLPRIPRRVLDKFLKDSLKKQLQGVDAAVIFDWNRWEIFYESLLMPHFVNLRAVKRFLNTFELQLAIFSGLAFEVNPVDLFAIEALRIFEPRVYSEILASKGNLILPSKKLVSTNQTVRRDDFLKPKAKTPPESVIETVIARIAEKETLPQVAARQRRESLERFLKELFPQTNPPEISTESIRQTGELSQWDKERRICSHMYVDRYFEISVPLGDLAQFNAAAISSENETREGFRDLLKDLSIKGLLHVALQRFHSRFHAVETPAAVAFVTALFDMSDEMAALGEVENEMFAFANDIGLSFCRRPRHQGLLKAVTETTGLRLPVFVVETILRESRPSMVLSTRESFLDPLIDTCFVKVKNAYQSGELIRHPAAEEIISSCLEWLRQEEANKFCSEIIGDFPGLVIQHFFPLFEPCNNLQGTDENQPFNQEMQIAVHVHRQFQSAREIVGGSQLINAISFMCGRPPALLSIKNHKSKYLLKRARTNDFYCQLLSLIERIMEATNSGNTTIQSVQDPTIQIPFVPPALPINLPTFPTTRSPLD